MTEFELLAALIPTFPRNDAVVKGAGDDCAVLDLGIPDQLVVFKTDAVVLDVHFTKQATPTKIGRKALARALSDLAAAAARPKACLVTAGLPRNFEDTFVREVYAGITGLAREHDVAVVGGETSRMPNDTLFSIAVLGTIPRDRVISRSGAQAGDALFVTGELGGSLEGRHLDFEPRLTEAQWLAENFKIHSMIDLSDGLAGDLRHILQASGVGAELHSRAIPITRTAKQKSKGESAAKPPLLAALTDGEDYELLFSVAPNLAVSLLDGWKARFPETRISCVGRITQQPGLRLRDKDGLREFGLHGYTHFQKS